MRSWLSFVYQAGVVEINHVGVVEVDGVKLFAHLVAPVCGFCCCLYDLWRLFGCLEVLFIARAQDVLHTCNLDVLWLWGYWENFYWFFCSFFLLLRIESA